ncbi:SDR family oxidoreductase [Nostoc sp. XA013]|nr:SDR family oxidoreductase [Nostoc sp. XA013]
MPTDVSKEADVKDMVEKTVAVYGRLDCAFNNAGIVQLPTPLIEQMEETFDQIMNVNAKGIWLSMKHEIPEMLKNNSGAIVNMSSVGGITSFRSAPIYTASKYAVLGLTKAVAPEYAKSGIRINAVCPGAIEIDIIVRFFSDNSQIEEQLRQMHPIGRIGKPEEVANAVTWLCSHQASFVTGHFLLIDGGFVAQ